MPQTGLFHPERLPISSIWSDSSASAPVQPRQEELGTILGNEVVHVNSGLKSCVSMFTSHFSLWFTPALNLPYIPQSREYLFFWGKNPKNKQKKNTRLGMGRANLGRRSGSPSHKTAFIQSSLFQAFLSPQLLPVICTDQSAGFPCDWPVFSFLGSIRQAVTCSFNSQLPHLVVVLFSPGLSLCTCTLQKKSLI